MPSYEFAEEVSATGASCCKVAVGLGKVGRKINVLMHAFLLRKMRSKKSQM